MTAPLPTLKGGFTYAITDKWLFDLALGWLAVSLELDDEEDLSGRILTATTGVRWKAFKYASFGLAYSAFDVEIDYRKRDLLGNLTYRYRGPILSVKFNY